MPKEFKPGFTYIYSETLKQEIALQDSTGKIFCQDGTVYDLSEIEEIKKHFGKLPLSVHLIKAKFGGKIIDGTRYKNKPAESKLAESRTDNTTSSTTIQTTFEQMPSIEQGQLDLS